MKFAMRAAAGAVLGVGLLSGCSFHAGSTPAVSAAKLAESVKQQLDASAGQTSKSVTCDGNLAGKVGATQRCVLTAQDGTRIGVTVTTTKADDKGLSFEVVADDEPMA